MDVLEAAWNGCEPIRAHWVDDMTIEKIVGSDQGVVGFLEQTQEICRKLSAPGGAARLHSPRRMEAEGRWAFPTVRGAGGSANGDR